MTRRNEHLTDLVTALIYTRVSTDEQAQEGVSLEAQLSECRKYAVARGWAIGRESQDVMSGKRDDRPEYRALLADAKRLRAEGQAVVIVVAALDRFGRKLLERVRCWEELKAQGVAVHSARDGGEVNEFTANILAAVAQEESRRLGERVQASRRYFIAGGWYPSCPCPWGYRWRAATAEERAQGAPASVLDVNPDTAPYVQEAYRRVARGESVRKTAAWVASLPSMARDGRTLGYQPVRRLLSSAVYVGRPWDGVPDVLSRPIGRWAALVDDATWMEVQTRIADHLHVPHQGTGRYLLSGLIRCPYCGGRMTAWRRKDRSPCYVCDALTRSTTTAGGRCRSWATAAPTEVATLAAITPLVEAITAATDTPFQDALERAWRDLQAPPETTAVEAQRQRLERLIAKTKQVLTNAGTLYAGGDLDKLGYDLVKDQAVADLNAAQGELDRLAPQAQPLSVLLPWEQVLRNLGGWGSALASADTAGQREVLRVLVDHVVPVRVGRGQYRAAIAWTPLGEALGRLAATLRIAEPAA